MTSVSKDILFLRVSMQIDEHVNPFLVLKDMSFYVKNFFAFLKFRRFPASVEVISSEIAARVSKNNSIRIDHWDYLDDILLQKSKDDVRTILVSWILYE